MLRTFSLLSLLVLPALPLLSSPPPATYDGLLVEADINADGSVDLDISMYGVPMLAGHYDLGDAAVLDYRPFFYFSATAVSVDPVADQVLIDMTLDVPFMNFSKSGDYGAPFGSMLCAWSPGKTVDWPELPPVDARAGFLAVPDRIRIGGDVTIPGCETTGWVEAMTPSHPTARVYNDCYGLFEAEVTEWAPFPRLSIKATGGTYEFDLKAMVPYGFYYFRYDV